MHITCAAICASDVALRTISNSLTLLISACSVYLLMLSEYTVWLHLANTATVIIIMLLVYIRGYAGGGDIKLMIAFSLAIPIGLLGDAFFNVAICGGVLSTIYLMKYRLLKMVPNNEEEPGLPYGVAISFGFLITIYKFYINR